MPDEINCLVSRNGIIIDVDQLRKVIGESGIAKLKNQLTVTHTNVIGKRSYVKKMLLYKFISVNEKIYMAVSRFSKIKSLIQEIIEQTYLAETKGSKNKNVNAKTSAKIDTKINYLNCIKIGESIATKFPQETLVDIEEYQQICVDYLMNNVYTTEKVKVGAASCIFVADTGQGKSYNTAALIEKLKQKTLIVIPNISNLESWYDPMNLYLKNLKLGEYHSKKKEDGDVVIMTIKSAIKDEFKFPVFQDGKKVIKTISSHDYFKRFGLVVYDEIHDFPTATYSEIFWRTNFTYGLGLTATPDENLSGMDVVYYKHVGKVIKAVEIPGFSDLVKTLEWKGKVEVIKYYGPPEYTIRYKNSANWTSATDMYKQFTRDPYRNKLIIDKITEKYQQGRYIFVFAVHRNILDDLYEILKDRMSTFFIDKTEESKKNKEEKKEEKEKNERENKNEENEEKNENKGNKEEKDTKLVKFMGGARDEEKKLAKNSARVIFTTYKYGKQGNSFPRMDTIIFIHPIRNKMRQTIGRILRKGGDIGIEREIIDIRDMNTTLNTQFNTRSKIYKEKKFPIESVKVNYTEIKLDQETIEKIAKEKEKIAKEKDTIIFS